MKKVYWRPAKVSRRIHLFIALTAGLGLLAVETYKVRNQQAYYKEKMKAARLMRDGMAAIRDYRMRELGPIDPEVDPTGSGMMGQLISPLTSSTGSLAAKQTSVNPNWAAVVVHMMKRAGVKRGDPVAVAFSGSFPALNLAVAAAIEALGLRPAIISSASSSMWGANHPKLTWLHMEKLLFERRILSHRSVAASLGGQADRGLGLGEEGRALLRKALEETGAPLIHAKSPPENLELRMARYSEVLGDDQAVLFINVGGGTISVGTTVGKKLFQPGLNRRPPPKALEIDSVMSRFAREGAAVIHLIQVAKLAKRYGLPTKPQTMPAIGDGEIFFREEYNLWLAAGVLLVIVTMLVAFMRMDLGHRIFHSGGPSADPKQPERMV